MPRHGLILSQNESYIIQDHFRTYFGPIGSIFDWHIPIWGMGGLTEFSARRCIRSIRVNVFAHWCHPSVNRKPASRLQSAEPGRECHRSSPTRIHHASWKRSLWCPEQGVRGLDKHVWDLGDSGQLRIHCVDVRAFLDAGTTHSENYFQECPAIIHFLAVGWGRNAILPALISVKSVSLLFITVDCLKPHTAMTLLVYFLLAKTVC